MTSTATGGGQHGPARSEGEGVLQVKTTLLMVTLLLTAASTVWAQAGEDSLDQESWPSYQPRFAPNDAFGPGERLVFSVEYGIVKAGSATMEVTGPEQYRGHSAYRITATARSSSAFSSFFRVEDVNEALMDIYQLHTLWFAKDLNEGDYSHSEEVIFYQDQGYAHYPDETDSSLVYSDIPPHALDILSSLYYARTLPLEVGETYAMDTHADNDNYPLLVKVLERETIRVPAGEFECIKVQPVLRSEAIFDQQGELYVWLTDDHRHMPVLMRSAIVIGEIACLLREYSNGEPLELESPFEPLEQPVEQGE